MYCARRSPMDSARTVGSPPWQSAQPTLAKFVLCMLVCSMPWWHVWHPPLALSTCSVVCPLPTGPGQLPGSEDVLRELNCVHAITQINTETEITFRALDRDRTGWVASIDWLMSVSRFWLEDCLTRCLKE